jgi:hypothetical protein
MSEFKFACPVCGQHMMCDTSQGGSAMECPTCFQKITAPQAPAPDAKFILTGTKVTEKRIFTRGLDPSSGPDKPGKKFSTVILIGILVLVLAGAGAALRVFSFSGAPLKHGAVGLGSWNTAVEFDDFVVTKGRRVLFKSDFPAGTAGWRFGKGSWATNNGILAQGKVAMDCRALVGDTNWGDYTISVRARKTGGNEGFLVIFNATDNDNLTWWNLGGWNNTKHAIQYTDAGRRITLGNAVNGQIESGKWYDLRVELSGLHIRCYLNNALVQDVTYPTPKP